MTPELVAIFLMSHSKATLGFLTMDLVLLKLGQVTKTSPEPASPLLFQLPYHTNGALDRFNVHSSPTRPFFGGPRLEFLTPRVRYLGH
ncbi:hypothetical protein TNCV_1656391 [Trichonephila clavipes]|nr:hypothetical protein TNCV_1656391 [Trichonephila clavipes]